MKTTAAIKGFKPCFFFSFLISSFVKLVTFIYSSIDDVCICLITNKATTGIDYKRDLEFETQSGLEHLVCIFLHQTSTRTTSYFLISMTCKDNRQQWHYRKFNLESETSIDFCTINGRYKKIFFFCLYQKNSSFWSKRKGQSRSKREGHAGPSPLNCTYYSHCSPLRKAKPTWILHFPKEKTDGRRPNKNIPF